MDSKEHKNGLNKELRPFFQKQVCLRIKQFCLTISLEIRDQALRGDP